MMPRAAWTPSELTPRLVEFNAEFEIPGSESVPGSDTLDEHFGGFGVQREAEGSLRHQ